MTTRSPGPAPLWRVRELYTATDYHTSTLAEWSELTAADAVRRYIRLRTADTAVYAAGSQISLHVLDPDGTDVTAAAIATLRAVYLHHAGECVAECPECRQAMWARPALAGGSRVPAWSGSDGE